VDVDVDVDVNVDVDVRAYSRNITVNIETILINNSRAFPTSLSTSTPTTSNASTIAAHSSADPRAIA